MRTIRMTEEEYHFAKQEIEDIKKQIENLRQAKNKLLQKVRWYENHEESKSYKNGFCFKKFGKRQKELTEEEMREYNRLLTEKSRNTHK